jgi:hypothetical protein
MFTGSVQLDSLSAKGGRSVSQREEEADCSHEGVGQEGSPSIREDDEGLCDQQESESSKELRESWDRGTESSGECVMEGSGGRNGKYDRGRTCYILTEYDMQWPGSALAT